MAYNRVYQYETSPRKLEPEYKRQQKKYPKKSIARKMSKHEEAKKKKKLQKRIIVYIALCFSALFVISYRYSAINDTYDTLKKEEARLALLEKETTQLEVNLENSLNLATIEKEAKERLGMKKLSPEQIVLVTLPKTDHVESSSEQVKSSDLEENWFMKIINKIIQEFK